MKRRLSGGAIVALVAGLMVGGYWWFSHGSQPTAEDNSAVAGKKASSQEPVASVEVAAIKSGAIAEETAVYGTIVPAAGAVRTVSVPFESHVRRVLVTEAQKVSRGDPLLEIEPSPDTNLQIQQARNDYESAKQGLQFMQQRFDLKLATNEQLLQAKQALEQAQAKLESQRRRGSEGSHTLHADVAGLISKVSVQEGAIVAAGASMVEMVAQNRLEARLGVEPEDSDKLKPNQGVVLMRVNAPGSDKINGRIHKISRAADATTRLVEVFVQLPPSANFLLGEYILGKIAVASRQGLIAPRSAVIPEEDHYVLFIVKDGRAREHIVRLGLQNGKEVEVVAADLHPGDLVASLGNYELKDGMAVKVGESQ